MGCTARAIAGGSAAIAAAQTSSHFCTAERQYRSPLPYGSQRSPTAQWTATAAGCCILGVQSEGPYITHITRGQIVDMGVTDMTNMGAAMAPAAFDTLRAVFRDTGTTPKDYDLIVTGDLGAVGSDILTELFRRVRRWTTTPTAVCCSMTGKSRTCTPAAAAAAARRRC